MPLQAPNSLAIDLDRLVGVHVGVEGVIALQGGFCALGELLDSLRLDGASGCRQREEQGVVVAEHTSVVGTEVDSLAERLAIFVGVGDASEATAFLRGERVDERGVEGHCEAP